MGRQFSFFLGPEDVERFNNVLADNPDIVFLDDRPLSAKPKVLDRLPSRSGLNGVLLTRFEDVNNMVFQSVATQPFFTIDAYTNNVIECHIAPMPYRGFLVEGRLYYNAIFWNQFDRKAKKSEAFLYWAERLFRHAKKSLTKVDNWYYAGEQALKWRQEGIKFHQLDGWPE